MRDSRPTRVMLALVVTAAVGFLGSALLDTNGKWGEPRQAAANVLWIIFLLSVVALIIVGARMLVHRRRAVG